MSGGDPRRPVGARVVILDRDGTLVVDRGYLDDPAGLEFLPGAAAGLRALQALGHRLVVITNQSGVGRGRFPVERVHAMNARLERMVEDAGARLAGIYVCPHAPEAGCDCRKPGQALMTQAAAQLGFDPATAVVIGDKESDVEFGRRAGALTMRIRAEEGGPGPGAPGPPAAPGDASNADFVVADLIEAAQILRGVASGAGSKSCYM